MMCIGVVNVTNVVGIVLRPSRSELRVDGVINLAEKK